MIQNSLKEALAEAIKSLDHDIGGDVILERPREASHGDLASPVALVIASRTKCNPRKLAQDIVERLEVDREVIEEIQVKGPGFINFTFSQAYFREVLREIIEEGEDFGKRG